MVEREKALMRMFVRFCTVIERIHKVQSEMANVCKFIEGNSYFNVMLSI